MYNKILLVFDFFQVLNSILEPEGIQILRVSLSVLSVCKKNLYFRYRNKQIKKTDTPVKIVSASF